MDRLTARDNAGNAVCKREYADDCNGKCSECDYDYECFKKLAYYEDLEEQGRLIVHPCKKGNTVYVIDWYEDCDIDGYGVCDEYGKYEEACMFCPHNVTKKFIREDKYTNHNLEDFGRRWFITREEAEAALNNA